MLAISDSVQQPTLIPEKREVTIEVPWERAEHFQEKLKRHGIASVLYLDARERRAYLEPWTNLHPHQVLGLLNGNQVPGIYG